MSIFSLSFEVAHKRLVIGAEETSHLMLLIERYEDKIDGLAALTRKLFGIEGLSDTDLAIVGLGYVRGQREFKVEVMYVTQEGTFSYTEDLVLEENENKRAILLAFLEGDDRTKGRRKGL